MECVQKVPIKDKDKGVRYVSCSKCATCLKNKRSRLMRRMLDESHIHENNSFIRFSYNDNSLDILPKFKKRFAEIEPMLSGFRKRIDDSVELNLSVTYWRKMYRQSEDYARAKCPKPILDYFDYTREVDSTAIINRRDIQLFWKRFRKNYDIS